jgi:hypothetical protein
MNKFYFTLMLLLLLTDNCYSQSDSLPIFREPTKNNKGVVNSFGSGNAYKNALSLSIAHLGRGGTMLTYERFIDLFNFSFFAGIGVNKIDYIGQYSFENEKYFYESDYTEKRGAELSKMFELGTKYYFDKDIGGGYLGLCYANYKNEVDIKVKDYYKVNVLDPRYYILNYASNEFKLLYGAANDISTRFYSDFHIGVGLRFINYQELDIIEVPIINSTYYEDFELSIEKDYKSETIPWLFFGFKIGARF